MKNLRHIYQVIFTCSTLGAPCMLYADVESRQSESTDEEASVLSTIRVSAKKSGQLNTGATKFALKDLETPQNVQTLDQKVLKQHDTQRIADAIALVSGVSQLNPMGGLWDNYSFRGFNTDQTIGTAALRNGVNAYLGLSAAHDMLNVERLEFLKGAEGAMYGAGDPGGSLNIVTKKPKFDSEHHIGLRAGSHEQYRAEFDSTGALSDTLAYRFGVAYENNHSFRDEVKNNRLFVAPQLTWQPTDQTQVDYDSEYTVINSVFDRGVMAVNQQLGVIPNSRFLGEKADGMMDMTDYLQQLRIKHQFSPEWSSETVLNYKDNSWRGFSSEAYQLLNQNGDLNRERRQRIYDTTSYLFSHDLKGQFATGDLEHQLLINTSYSHLNIRNYLLRYRQKNSTASLINIYNPVYGVNLPTVSPAYDTHENQHNLALSLNDLIRFNSQWSVLLGGRLDYYQQDYRERLGNTSGSQNFVHFSPKIAVNYLIQPDWSAYLSAGKSFHLNSGLDQQGQAFAPEKAMTYELGMKKHWWDDRVSSSIAVFHITKDNVLTTNPNDSAYMISAGQETSRGIELDLSAQPLDRLNLKLAYSYTDASVSKTTANSGIAKGSRLLNSPKHAANLFAMYDIWQSGEQKVGIGGNLQYVSARSGNVYDNGFELPAYTLMNLNAYYQVNARLRYQFTFNNVFDKTYYVSSVKDEWVTPGNLREMFISVNYQF